MVPVIVLLVKEFKIYVLRLDYGGLGLTWQNCNISAIYHGI